MLHGTGNGHVMLHSIGNGHVMLHGIGNGHVMLHGIGNGHVMLHGIGNGHVMLHGIRNGHVMLHGIRNGHVMLMLHGIVAVYSYDYIGERSKPTITIHENRKFWYIFIYLRLCKLRVHSGQKGTCMLKKIIPWQQQA